MNWIVGEKFVGVADFVFVPDGAKDCNTLVNTFCHCMLKEMNIIYTHTLYVKQLFEKIDRMNCKFIIISHNCDENVDSSYKMPDNVVKWFSQNVDVDNPKIESIPIGLENSKWFKTLGKRNLMLNKLKEKRNYKNLLYLNCNVNTNPLERAPVYQLLQNNSWVTVERGINGKMFEEYLDNVYNHKYVACPRGNGIDTHRLWEALYMGSVPIVKKDINNWFYNELPILYVNEWNEVNEDLLNDMWEIFRNGKYNKKMLEFDYWENYILSYVGN